MMRERLPKIIYWQPGPDSSIPMAFLKGPINRDGLDLQEPGMMSLALLQAEAATGLEKKPVADIAKAIRYDPLAGEVRAVIVAASEHGRMLSKSVIEG